MIYENPIWNIRICCISGYCGGHAYQLPAFTEQKFTLHFKEAEVPDEEAFKKALKALKEHGGQYKIRLKHNNEVTDPYDPLSLKTDKVTKSEVANRAAAGESTASITYKVTSADPTDVEGVLKTLK